MMDLKEIIKWFIPCFHILLVIIKEWRLTFVCLFLLFNIRVGCAANVKSVVIVNSTKNVDSIIYDKFKLNQSDVRVAEVKMEEVPDNFKHFQRSLAYDGSVGRTFGRPFKKMMSALIPLVFQIGAASTWAVVAALVGIKTLAVTLLILKILLVAGAAKAFAVTENAVLNYRRHVLQGISPSYTDISQPLVNATKYTAAADWVQAQKIGALFGSKGHGHYSHQGWEAPRPPHSPQKEIHLHIHNGHHETHEDVSGYGPWSREDATNVVNSNQPAINPYSVIGPQTIKTPFGNYVRVESNDLPHPARRK